MATSFRLPEDLKRDASAYAARCGVPLNAVVKIALRTYLDAAAGGAGPGPAPAPEALPQLRREPGRQIEYVPDVAPRAAKTNRSQRRAAKKSKR